MSHVELTTSGGTGGSGRLLINGVDVSNKVVGVTLTVEVNSANRAYVTYACQTFEFDGEMDVVHVCPLTGEEL